MLKIRITNTLIVISKANKNGLSPRNNVIISPFNKIEIAKNSPPNIAERIILVPSF